MRERKHYVRRIGRGVRQAVGGGRGRNCRSLGWEKEADVILGPFFSRLFCFCRHRREKEKETGEGEKRRAGREAFGLQSINTLWRLRRPDDPVGLHLRQTFLSTVADSVVTILFPLMSPSLFLTALIILTPVCSGTINGASLGQQ